MKMTAEEEFRQLQQEQSRALKAYRDCTDETLRPYLLRDWDVAVEKAGAAYAVLQGRKVAP